MSPEDIVVYSAVLSMVACVGLLLALWVLFCFKK